MGEREAWNTIDMIDSNHNSSKYLCVLTVWQAPCQGLKLIESSQQSYGMNTGVSPILQMKRPRHRQVKYLLQVT